MTMYRTFATAIACIFFLSSCSFNMGLKSARTRDTEDQTKLSTLCSAFVLPELESMPMSPIAEIMRIDSRNKDAQIAVLVKHITELKEHNAKQRNTILNQYKMYLQSCK
jgi:PBP1b-binding outer membrane lipoprotein LpoB